MGTPNPEALERAARTEEFTLLRQGKWACATNVAAAVAHKYGAHSYSALTRGRLE